MKGRIDQVDALIWLLIGACAVLLYSLVMLIITKG